jgi:hypothetical protein
VDSALRWAAALASFIGRHSPRESFAPRPLHHSRGERAGRSSQDQETLEEVWGQVSGNRCRLCAALRSAPHTSSDLDHQRELGPLFLFG